MARSAVMVGSYIESADYADLVPVPEAVGEGLLRVMDADGRTIELVGLDALVERRLRPARAGDLGAAEALLARCALPVAGLRDQFPAGHVVADSAGMVGLAGLEVHGDHGLLRSVAVDGGARDQCLGRALVEDRLSDARAIGLASVFL
jgi:ribosomal protein S18 acetylase RimI-like enzyme